MAVLAGFVAQGGLMCYGGSERCVVPRWPGASPADGADSGSGGARRELHIGLCVPMGGLTGIWGPSALASAKLATAELNRGSGIGGRSCRLVLVNADDGALMLESVLTDLVHSGEVDALVGMHTSAVRQDRKSVV